MEKFGVQICIKNKIISQPECLLLFLSKIGVSNKKSSLRHFPLIGVSSENKKNGDLKRLQKTSKDLKRPQKTSKSHCKKLYLSRSPLETERWWSVPESPPSDNDPSSSGSTDPALGLLRDLREPPLSIWDAKDGTLFLRWRLPIELCSDTARFA